MTREELIEAAGAAFASHGYKGASLGVISEALGVRKASLFHHVKNKEMLYLEVLGGMLMRLGELLQSAQLGKGTYLERLDRLGDLVVSFLGTHPHAARLLYREMMDEGPFFTSGGREQALATLQVLVDFLEEGIADGALPKQDAHQLAMSMVGLHFTWYAVANLSGPLSGQDVFSGDALNHRKKEIQAQVRRICGA